MNDLGTCWGLTLSLVIFICPCLNYYRLPKGTAWRCEVNGSKWLNIFKRITVYWTFWTYALQIVKHFLPISTSHPGGRTKSFQVLDLPVNLTPVSLGLVWSRIFRPQPLDKAQKRTVRSGQMGDTTSEKTCHHDAAWSAAKTQGQFSACHLAIDTSAGCHLGLGFKWLYKCCACLMSHDLVQGRSVMANVRLSLCLCIPLSLRPSVWQVTVSIFLPANQAS